MIKKEKLIEAVRNIPTVAQREKWVLTFDKEEGSLFYSPESISDGAELHQVTDEYAIYTDKDFNPKGVMVEYYNVNFVKHHNMFKELSSQIFKGKEKIQTVNPTKKEEGQAVLLKALLESTLIKEADTSLIPA